jgi:hypothetical protein
MMNETEHTLEDLGFIQSDPGAWVRGEWLVERHGDNCNLSIFENGVWNSVATLPPSSRLDDILIAILQ